MSQKGTFNVTVKMGPVYIHIYIYILMVKRPQSKGEYIYIYMVKSFEPLTNSVQGSC